MDGSGALLLIWISRDATPQKRHAPDREALQWFLSIELNASENYPVYLSTIQLIRRVILSAEVSYLGYYGVNDRELQWSA